MKIFLNIIILFKKESEKKFVAVRTVNIVKDTMSFSYVMVMKAYYQSHYIQAVRVMLKHDGILAFAKRLYGENA